MFELRSAGNGEPVEFFQKEIIDKQAYVII